MQPAGLRPAGRAYQGRQQSQPCPGRRAGAAQGIGGEYRGSDALADAQPGFGGQSFCFQLGLHGMETGEIIIKIVDAGALAAGQAMPRQVPQYDSPTAGQQPLQQVAIKAEVIVVAVYHEDSTEGSWRAPHLSP